MEFVDRTREKASLQAIQKHSLVENNSAQISKIEIYDINGRIITSSDCPINIETLPLQPGVYVVRTIFADNTFETNKIIK